MLYRDYFERIFELLALALAKISFLKEQLKYDEALLEIMDTGKKIVGLDLNMLNYISDVDMLRLFKSEDPSNAGKFIVLAGLLNEEGDIYFNTKNNSGGYVCYLKSLVLYCEALKFNDIINPQDYFDKIEKLIINLKDFDLPWNTKNSLINYYEISGKYSKAEDLIFELAEAGDEQVISSGIAFYNRLLLKTDEEIENGNLNREEIQNAILELSKFAH
jgi:hypothetical protein